MEEEMIPGHEWSLLNTVFPGLTALGHVSGGNTLDNNGKVPNLKRSRGPSAPSGAEEERERRKREKERKTLSCERKKGMNHSF